MFEKLEKLQEVKERYQASATGVIRDTLQTFIRQYPGIKAIGWVQYTPYFNDGEPCVFGVQQMVVSKLEDNDRAYDLYEEGWIETWMRDTPQGFSTEEWEACRDLSSRLQNLEDELKVAFGDHARITVTASGIVSDEYSHE